MASWNGATWVAAKVPAATSHSGLSGVGCATATKCLAVGFAFHSATFGYEKATAASLTGTRWALTKAAALSLPSDYNSEFAAVVCLSPAECVTVGTDSLDTWAAPHGVSAFWDGKTWRLVTMVR